MADVAAKVAFVSGLQGSTVTEAVAVPLLVTAVRMSVYAGARMVAGLELM